MAGEKIKIEGEASSEIVVADTASELGAEASDVNRVDGGGGGGGEQKQQALAEVATTKHWPANLTVLPSVFFSQPKKGHTVRQM